MNKFNPTDEEILSFLMKDCSKELSQKINEEIKSNADLKDRIESIALIRSEVRLFPLLKKRKQIIFLKPSWLLRQTAFASVIFVLGLIAESNLNIISNRENIETKPELSVSRPLNWDGPKLTSLM